MRIPQPEQITNIAEAAEFAIYFIQVGLAWVVFTLGIIFIHAKMTGEDDADYLGITK
jgi:hypothetical protein